MEEQGRENCFNLKEREEGSGKAMKIELRKENDAIAIGKKGDTDTKMDKLKTKRNYFACHLYRVMC
jgi:hypothetical protein